MLHENQHRRRMQQHAQTVGDTLHHRRSVGQAMQRGRDLHQNASAAMLFAGKLVQTQGFKRRAKLGRQNRDFSHRIIVKTAIRRTLEKCNGAYDLPGDQQRCGQRGVRVARHYPRITGGIEVIDKEGAALFHRIHGKRGATAPAYAAKRFGVLGVRLRSDQLAIGGTRPVISSTGPKKGTADDTKRADQLAGIAALKSRPGKRQKKLLKRRLRLRRFIRGRISWVACQIILIIELSN